MKKSHLKQFIKEEILNVLKESVNEDIKVGDKFTTIDYGKNYNWWVTKEDDGLIELDNNNPRWSKFGLATKEFEGLVKSGQFTPVKESVNEVQQTFDGLIQLAKKVRGFKQVSKQGFSIPYEYGNVEFHDEGYEGSVGVYWQNDNAAYDEDTQPLSVAYRIVKGKI